MAKRRRRRRKPAQPPVPKWVELLSKKVEAIEAEERSRGAKRNGAR